MSNTNDKPQQHTEQDEKKPWYWIPSDKLEIPPETLQLFEEYSGIPKNEVLQHVISIRDKAWSCIPFPCIGGFRFLALSLHPPSTTSTKSSTPPSFPSPFYETVMGKLRSDPTSEFLDVGCCFGQDVRAAAYYSKQNSSRFHGLDINTDLINLGYDLFRDKDTFGSSFHVGNILSSPDDNDLKLEDLISDPDKLGNKISIVHAALFLHLFNWGEQVLACKRIIQLILKDEKGVLFTGRQLGNSNPGEYRSKVNPSKMRHLHDEGSFKRLWKEVGEKTGTQWDVDVRISDVGEYSGTGGQENEEEGAVYMVFCVTRVG